MSEFFQSGGGGPRHGRLRLGVVRLVREERLTVGWRLATMGVAAALCALFGSAFVGTAHAQALPSAQRATILQSVVAVWSVSGIADDPRVVAKGSGTIISPEGHILTNWHVVVDEDGELAEVFFILVSDPDEPELAPGLAYAAVLVDGDPALDLALLQIALLPTGELLPDGWSTDYVIIGDSDVLLPGDWVTVVGYPGISGETITVTTGIVSGFVAEDASSSGREWIKTDAKLARGNSGGGAFDTSGLLIGVPTLRTSQAAGDLVESQELLRPISMALPMLERGVAGFTEILARPAAAPTVVDQTEAGDTAAPAQPETAPSTIPPSSSGRPRASTEPVSPLPASPSPPGESAPPGGSVDTPRPATDPPLEIAGKLGRADSSDERGRYVNEYTLQLAAGEQVSIAVSSTSFDPAARLLAPDGSVAFDVDDSPGQGLNVSELYEAPMSGVFTLIVTSAYAQESGDYLLTIGGVREVAPSSTTSVPAPAQHVTTGAMDGVLTSSSRVFEGGFFFDTFDVRMDARSLVSISVTSFAFEPAVALTGPDGEIEVSFGEASVSGKEATIAFVPAMSGTYTIYVASDVPGTTGSFSVAVSGAQLLTVEAPDLPRTGSPGVSPPASPTSSLPVDGHWQGTVLDSLMGTGQATVRLQQTGDSVVGTWHVAFSGGANGGLAQGQLVGSEAVLELIPLDPAACPFRAVVSLTGSTLVGSYETLECSVFVTGTMSLRRR